MVSNRDEFYARATQGMHYWPDKPAILAGRDLEAGGTWLGISKRGRIAALTNVREQPEPRAFSRGHLVTAWLEGRHSEHTFAQWVQDQSEQLAGYNLLFGDDENLFWATNRTTESGFSWRELSPSLYSLSNASLNTPWPKAELAKERLEAALARQHASPLEAWCEIVSDRAVNPDLSHYDEDSMGSERLLALSAQWIHTPDYGTRATTVVRRSKDGYWECLEQTFDDQAQLSASAEFSFQERR